MICLFHNSIHFSLLSFPRNCKRCYLDCVHPNPDIFENHTFYMNTAFSQSLLINSLEWRIRGKRARETPHIFAWTTWPEMLWPRVIMRPGDLGSLSNDDNDSVKKKLVLSAKQLLCTCITFLSTFELSFSWRPLHDYDVQPPNATFHGGRGHWQWQIFLYSTPGKVAYMWRTERFQIDAMEFERTKFFLLVIFSLPSSLLLLSSPVNPLIEAALFCFRSPERFKAPSTNPPKKVSVFLWTRA